MDLSADAAFVNNTRPGTPVPPALSAEASSSAGSSKLERRDSSSTIRPQQVEQKGVDGNQDAADVEKTEVDDAQAKAAGLEQEVGQVVQQLSTWGGSFWGGFKKQADSALVAVRKDFARTVAEAQDEIKMLQTQTASFEVHKPDINLGAIGAAIAEGVKSDSKPDKGKGKEVVTEENKGESTSSGSIPQLPSAKQTQDFFKNLQATLTTEANQINANVSSNFSSLQKSVSESIAKNPSLKISTLSATIQQNLEKAGTKINLSQAEKLAQDFLGEAGTFLKDAVKVVPPDEGSGSYTYSWDGTDVGVYGSGYPSDDKDKSTVLFDRASMSGNDMSRSQLRLNALLRRLRTDVELLLQDPSAASETRARQEAFSAFKKQKVEGAGGYQGPEVQKLVWAEMGPEANDADVEALKKTKDAIVPGKVTEEEFWTRYLFHKHNIEDEEKKRQELLQAAQPKEEEEDFSWDAEEAEAEPEAESQKVTPKMPSAPTPEPVKANADEVATKVEPAVPSPVTAESAATSRRQSEESYDIVSEQSGGNGAQKKQKASVEKKQEDTDGDDSDWE